MYIDMCTYVQVCVHIYTGMYRHVRMDACSATKRTDLVQRRQGALLLLPRVVHLHLPVHHHVQRRRRPSTEDLVVGVLLGSCWALVQLLGCRDAAVVRLHRRDRARTELNVGVGVTSAEPLRFVSIVKVAAHQSCSTGRETHSQHWSSDSHVCARWIWTRLDAGFMARKSLPNSIHEFGSMWEVM